MPGLDRSIVAQLSSEESLSRIISDSETDFIYSPPYQAVFQLAGDELWELTKRKLESGTYNPDLPLTISVPKPGNFTRPGSILNPVDRLVYQALADVSQPVIEQQLDRERVFSNQMGQIPNSGAMFEDQIVCRRQLQENIEQLAATGGYFVLGDIAHYFERIPQHHLINLIRNSGVEGGIVNLLEEMLLAFQERNSFGIIQGLFPSDLYGNFYLSDLDANCELENWTSLRFVDDFYIHFQDYESAQSGLSKVIEHLRRDGLHLNEGKSSIRHAGELVQEETELDRLLAEAWEEVREEYSDLNVEYGFSTEWTDEDEETQSDVIEIESVERVYQRIHEFPQSEDKIERFCLPILRAASSPVAIDRSLKGIRSKPYLSRLYLSYLKELIKEDESLSKRLQDEFVRNEFGFDHQRLYLLAALITAKNVQKDAVLKASRLLGDPTVHPAVRATSALLTSKHGAPQFRRIVRTSYEKETSEYVRSAILFSTIFFTAVERKTCISAWGAHSEINTLIVQAIKKIS